MKHRRGASLIELLVVIAMISSVLLMTGPLFHRLFMADQVSSRAALMEITTSRLAIQFRRDVHAAQTATRVVDVATGRQSLELRSESNPPIVYSGETNQVRRDVIGGDGPTARETYRLPRCRVEFLEPAAAAADGADQRTPPQLVTLVIERPHTPLSGSSLPARSRRLTLDAELGRDRRLTAHVSPAAATVLEDPK